MVFPKPSLRYRYKYRLPDHVRRRQTKWKTKHHEKIYELLSDQDLFDIRGVGLARLDAEEAALFEKNREDTVKVTEIMITDSAERKEEQTETVNKTEVEVVGVPSKSTRGKRASLIRELRALRGWNQEKMEDITAYEAPMEGGLEDKEVASIMDWENENSSIIVRKITTRARKRKAVETKETSGEAPVVKSPSIVKDDSYKENETEWTTGTDHNMNKMHSPVNSPTSSDVLWKAWRVSKSTVIDLIGSSHIAETVQVSDEEKAASIVPHEGMNMGLVKLKLSTLKELSTQSDCIKVVWPTVKSIVSKKKSKKKKAHNSRKKTPPSIQPPTLLGPFESSEPKQKKGVLVKKPKLNVEELEANPKSKVTSANAKTGGKSKTSNPQPNHGELKTKQEPNSKIRNVKRKTVEPKQKLVEVKATKVEPKANKVTPTPIPSTSRGCASAKTKRLPELTTTQILRKVRYAIEKYFAQMPGTGYRCPGMRERSHRCTEDDPNQGKVWFCLVCHKEELDEKGDVMICCDRCEDWYHLRCVGVPSETYPSNMKWYCKRCMAQAIREGTFDPQQFPLYV